MVFWYKTGLLYTNGFPNNLKLKSEEAGRWDSEPAFPVATRKETVRLNRKRSGWSDSGCRSNGKAPSREYYVDTSVKRGTRDSPGFFTLVGMLL